MKVTHNMWDQSLGQEGPLEKEMAIHSSTVAWKIPWIGGAWWAAVHGAAESDMTERHVLLKISSTRDKSSRSVIESAGKLVFPG